MDLWPLGLASRTVSALPADGDSGGGSIVFSAAELAPLLGRDRWREGEAWTMRLKASSECSHALQFGLAATSGASDGGTGQLLFAVPGLAVDVGVSVTFGVTGPLATADSVFLQALSTCADADDGTAKPVALRDVRAAPGDCSAWPGIVPLSFLAVRVPAASVSSSASSGEGRMVTVAGTAGAGDAAAFLTLAASAGSDGMELALVSPPCAEGGEVTVAAVRVARGRCVQDDAR
jgi:hypothetical protein